MDWYCTLGCQKASDCKHVHADGTCAYAYDAVQYEPSYRWPGNGAPPRRWIASNGTIVYRSLADYYDD